MYIKRGYYDINLLDCIEAIIVDELLMYNKDSEFGIPKFFIEKKRFGKIKDKLNNKNKKRIIYTSTPISELRIPNEYSITDGNLIYLIKAENINAKLIETDFKYKSEMFDETIEEDFYLDINVKKAKRFKKY